MSDFSGLYNIRNAISSDHNFVIATFLRGIYYGDTFFSAVPKGLFMDRYKLVAQALVKDPSTKIRIACLPEDQDVIIGYSITSNNDTTLNWAFVKKNWREKGIAKSLIPNIQSVVPQHVTHPLGKILTSKYKDLTPNPFY
jgi:hypothetical protein